MNLVDREGTFRCRPVDWAVGETKNGFPQFTVKVHLTEYYDEQEKEWIPWEEYEQEVTAFLVLFDSNENRTKNFQQIEKVFGWDGTSFLELNNGRYEEVEFQIRVAENNYNGKIGYQVAWIDEREAEPNRTVKKLDDKELKQLEAKFSKSLSNKSAKATKAPAKTTKAPAKNEGVEESKKAPPAKPAIPKISNSKKRSKPVDSITKEEAWEYVCNNKLPTVDDDELTASWLRCVNNVADGRDEEELTGKDWANIRSTVLDEIGGEIPF